MAQLRLRPYMSLSQWKGAVRHTIDYCAYGAVVQKATDIWTSLVTWTPKGTAGDGRCHGRCGQGEWHTDAKGYQHYRHHKTLAQEPQKGYRGPGATKMKNSIPTALCDEWLQQAMQTRTSNKQKIVIDLCCGYRSMQPAAEALGLTYIGVDIRGDIQ